MVAPLDWGLGHATRCIPIIDRLLAQQVRVILAGSGPSLTLLQQHYPTLPAEELPAYNIVYGKGTRLEFAIASQLPHIRKTIQAEHTQLQELIHTYSLDGCISDNRYGLWSDQIPSAFICHQLNNPATGPFWFYPALLIPHSQKIYPTFLSLLDSGYGAKRDGRFIVSSQNPPISCSIHRGAVTV